MVRKDLLLALLLLLSCECATAYQSVTSTRNLGGDFFEDPMNGFIPEKCPGHQKEEFHFSGDIHIMDDDRCDKDDEKDMEKIIDEAIKWSKAKLPNIAKKISGLNLIDSDVDPQRENAEDGTQLLTFNNKQMSVNGFAKRCNMKTTAMEFDPENDNINEVASFHKQVAPIKARQADEKMQLAKSLDALLEEHDTEMDSFKAEWEAKIDRNKEDIKAMLKLHEVEVEAMEECEDFFPKKQCKDDKNEMQDRHKARRNELYDAQKQMPKDYEDLEEEMEDRHEQQVWEMKQDEKLLDKRHKDEIKALEKQVKEEYELEKDMKEAARDTSVKEILKLLGEEEVTALLAGYETLLEAKLDKDLRKVFAKGSGGCLDYKRHSSKSVADVIFDEASFKRR